MTRILYVSREDEFGEVVVYDLYAATALHQLQANDNEIVSVDPA